MTKDTTPPTDFTPTRWRASSHSQGNGACVEVADGLAVVPVRDSKDTTRQHLTIPTRGWTTFVTALTTDQLR